MEYLNVVCNGKTHSNQQNATIKKENHYEVQNLNYLLYIMYARGDYNYCNKIIEHQLETLYDHEYVYFIKGLISRDENRLQESIYCLQRAIEFNPTNPDNFKEIGKSLYQMGRLKQALEVFLKAESLLSRPDHEIYYYLGDLLYRNIGQPRAGLLEAKEYFHRAMLNGKQVESYRKLAEIYIKENDNPKAIEMLENSLQVSQKNPDILSEIGVLYLKINDPQSAFDKLQEAIEIDRTHPKALIALGAVLQSRNDVDGALNKYKNLNDNDKDSAELWSNIGLCFFRKQKMIAAIACLKKSAWTSPLNFNVLHNLGLVLMTAHQYASSFHTLAAAINLRPDNAECYMLLGVCLKNLNDPGNAYLAFEKSVMLPESIKNPLIYLNFSIFCYQIGKYDKSHLYLGNFMKMIQEISVSREYLRMADDLKNALPPIVVNNDEDVEDNLEEGKNVDDIQNKEIPDLSDNDKLFDVEKELV